MKFVWTTNVHTDEPILINLDQVEFMYEESSAKLEEYHAFIKFTSGDTVVEVVDNTLDLLQRLPRYE